MSKQGDFEAVREDIAALLKQPGYDDGSAGPVFVRLAWYKYHLGVFCITHTNDHLQALCRNI